MGLIKEYKENKNEVNSKLQKFYEENINEDGSISEENLNRLFKLQDDEMAYDIFEIVLLIGFILIVYFGFKFL